MDRLLRSKELSVVLVFIFIVFFVWLHLLAGYSFPVPWEDEAAFVLQAKALAEHGTLFSPALNPDRVIEWMPPGYMVVLSPFLLFPESPIFIARSVSFLFVLIAFVTLAVAIRRMTDTSLLVLLILGFCFSHRLFILLGNIARMEALLFGLAALAIYFLGNKKTGIALSILCLTPLIHPNGLYFLLGGCLYVMLAEGLSCSKPGYTVRIWIVVVIVAWISYGIHVFFHSRDFFSDMAMQMQRKSSRDVWGQLFHLKPMLMLLAVIASILFSYFRRNKGALLLSVFALSFWTVNRMGLEMWYIVFDTASMMFVLLAVMVLAGEWRSKLLLIGSVVVVFYLGRYSGVIENPTLYPDKFDWLGMKMQDSVTYITKTDLDKVRAFLRSKRVPGQKLRVKFEPKSDGLFFMEKEDSLIHIIHAQPETSIFPPQKHDAYVIHISKYFPADWQQYPIGWASAQAGIDISDPGFELFRRDSTEVWFVNK